MELNHDWRGFQAVFAPRRRGPARAAPDSADTSAMVFLVVDGTIVISASGAEGEDVSSWIGMTVTEVAGLVPNRELVLFTRKEVDQWMSGCLQLPHFHDQVEYLRNQSVPEAISAQGKVKKIRPVARRHFLLDALRGWWSKILPTRYGIFIRLEGPSPGVIAQEIFLVVQRGRLDLFHAPDLSSLGNERIRKADAVVRYLSEKHMVPVQGLFVPVEDWAAWCESQREPGNEREAWRELAFAVKANRARLVPFRWPIVVLGAAKGFFGV